MKIISPGTFVFANEFSTVTGWHFDVDGCVFNSTTDMDRACLKAVLIHIATVSRIDLSAALPLPDAMTLDSERDALDAIAIARWMPQ